jgi:hypothetical protein
VPASDRYAFELQQLAADELLIRVIYDKLVATGNRQMADQLMLFVTRKNQALSSMREESRRHVVDMNAQFVHGKSDLLRKVHGMLYSIQTLHNKVQSFEVTEPLWE